MPAARRPAWFARWSQLLDDWLAWCERHDLSPQQAAIAFVAAQGDVERYVIGVDSLEQLEELLAVNSASAHLPPAGLASEDIDLIDPSRWKLQ
jgi:aryl-alcohol dehydrogenase-like predicted oxidoreductase